MPTIQDSAYDRNRRIGRPTEAAGGFRPRLGTELEIFGTPIALTPVHALVVLGTAYFAGTEGLFALLIVFLGWFLMKAMPAAEAPAVAHGSAGRTAPRPRRPGLWGWIMHFVGPVPEGAAVTVSEALSEGTAELSGGSFQPAGAAAGATGVPRAARAAAPKKEDSAASAEAERARSAAARAAAARAAAARAAAAADEADGEASGSR
jgi:hypothetical protein